MNKLLLIIFTVMSFIANSQFCNTASTNMGTITPTTSWVNVAANSGAKRYWTFTATVGCTYDFSSCNSVNTNDTYLRLYQGTVQTTAVLVASNDDNGPWCTSTKASLSWTCTVAGNYSILLTNYSCANISSNSILSYRVTCAPPYNPCSSISALSCGVATTFTVGAGTGAYNPPTTSCGFSTPGQEKIFQITPTITGNYTISQPTSFGYIDWFYKTAGGGCNGSGWTCIDDISNTNVGNANVNILLSAGVTYYLLADPEGSTGGSVTFTLNCPVPPPPPPANDNCINATTISLPYNSGVISTAAATTDDPGVTSACGTFGFNVWYKVVGNNKTFTASTCNAGTNFDTEVRVYQGSCGAMSETICNDDDAACSFSTLRSTATWCALSGVTYYISVGYYSSTTGTGNFELSVIEGTQCSALPVELMSFEGLSTEKGNLLVWKTATEHNSDYYLIERSITGEFTENSIIGHKQAVGNSTTETIYSFIDNQFEVAINYYRLVQVDIDGQFKVYGPIAIDNSSKQKKIIKTFNMMGQECIPNATRGMYFEMYEDGTIKKVYK